VACTLRRPTCHSARRSSTAARASSISWSTLDRSCISAQRSAREGAQSENQWPIERHCSLGPSCLTACKQPDLALEQAHVCLPACQIDQCPAAAAPDTQPNLRDGGVGEHARPHRRLRRLSAQLFQPFLQVGQAGKDLQRRGAHSMSHTHTQEPHTCVGRSRCISWPGTAAISLAGLRLV
jgi:hypothetical protein